MSKNPYLAHQFDDIGQQRHAVELGMWTFLVTEIMFFGGLFLGFTVYGILYSNAFTEGSHHLDVRLGAINTVILITSSLTMVLAVHAAQVGKNRALSFFLALTILLGAAFLGIKVVEYAEKFQHHLIPGPEFSYHEFDYKETQLFYCFYFLMTGMHALHMIIGIGILSVLLFFSMRNHYSENYNSPIEMTGLYWHFVDIVWIFLFPLLYLIGRHL